MEGKWAEILATFSKITNHISTAVESVSHYLCSPPQRLKNSFAATTHKRDYYSNAIINLTKGEKLITASLNISK